MSWWSSSSRLRCATSETKQTSEPPDAATTTQNADERDGRSLSRARGSRVFAYAYAAPSTSARSASLGGAWGKRKAAALAEAVARANDATKKAGGDPTGIEPATAAANAEGFPARATHLLMDVDETNTFVRSRTVKYLEAVARGAWVLPFSYLERCAEANRWLPERDFELEDLGRGRRALDGSWVAPGRSDDDEVRDETKALAVFGVGPAGDRLGVHREGLGELAQARGDRVDFERESATWSTTSFMSYHGQLLSLAVQLGVATEILNSIKHR